jgi:hypothetical protein
MEANANKSKRIPTASLNFARQVNANGQGLSFPMAHKLRQLEKLMLS